VLTWLKEIIRDNLLFDERNPAMIVGDAPLEAAFRKKKVHVNDIRSVVIQQRWWRRDRVLGIRPC
jgi:hypothetical protein